MNVTLNRPAQLLRPKGSFWRDLQQFQKTELLTQIPSLKTDPNYCNYKYYYSVKFKSWIICNAFSFPVMNKTDLNKVKL